MFRNPIELEFDGVRVKSPAVGGITRKPEKIWSKNTGRSASQQMQGTIKAIKYTYTFKWPPLSQYEKEVIEGIVSDKDKPFHIIRIRNPDGSVEKVECYFGTPTFTEWVWLDGQWKASGATVDAIER